ncbi:MAG: dethiobiotin synthase [Gammaproteobacteria bacterium]|nr:MAG: dethiobiotin synthase [Gammaproteobacteria bacterium]RLA53266.1 MAG: dethiobiotin synthase [Gammaproteobacteria bacterium]
MNKAYFVTGTDTGVGKTTVAVALLHAAAARGLTTAAIKPVAAGCEMTPDGLRNDDALQLQRACTLDIDYQHVNPVALEPAIAPHFVAQQSGLELQAAQLAEHCRSILALGADFTVIEGAGGWRVPLNNDETFADIASALNIPVILVVDIKLGCLNHALLSAEAIRGDGLSLAAWVANRTMDKGRCHEQMVEDLRARLGCPLLGGIPYMQVIDETKLAMFVDIESLVAN